MLGNHSKVKARDIIPGWPKGRSTTEDARINRYSYKEFCWNWEYHRRQEEMLDLHHSEYRRPTPAWLARRMMASHAGIVIATSGEIPGTITLGRRSLLEEVESRQEAAYTALGARLRSE